MINGNTTGQLQRQTTSKNEFGEVEKTWETAYTLEHGFLDYTGGDGGYKSQFKGAVEQTTHLFICDFVQLENKPTLKRMVVNDAIYEVLYIDDPMELHDHLEVFMKYTEVVQ